MGSDRNPSAHIGVHYLCSNDEVARSIARLLVDKSMRSRRSTLRKNTVRKRKVVYSDSADRASSETIANSHRNRHGRLARRPYPNSYTKRSRREASRDRSKLDSGSRRLENTRSGKSRFHTAGTRSGNCEGIRSEAHRHVLRERSRARKAFEDHLSESAIAESRSGEDNMHTGSRAT